jgi:hypothetical protein
MQTAAGRTESEIGNDNEAATEWQRAHDELLHIAEERAGLDLDGHAL